MKNLSKKAKIITLLILIIIIVGIAITLKMGFNFDLRFQDTKKVQMYLGKEFEISDIKSITDETIPNKYVIIQKVEVYEDSVSIIAKDINDEEKTNLINKINEKYETELSSEDVEIISIPKTQEIDLIKPYFVAFSIAIGITLLYMAIRYYKLGFMKIILKTAGISILAQIILLSIIAITRIPIGRLTIPMIITIYMLTLIGLTTKFEKQLETKKQTEKDEKEKEK